MVEEVSSEILQDIYEEIKEDPIINEAFQSVVGKRTGHIFVVLDMKSNQQE